MNHAWVLSFVAFADHLSFTRAARQLHISQPALYVQIKKLAESIGRPLYRRDGKALALTAEGKRLAAFGRDLAERSGAVVAELRGEVATTPVVLAAGQGVLVYLLGAALRRAAKPLRVLALPGPAAIEAVRDARAHLAVAATENPPPDLVATHIADVGQHVVMPASHALARRREIRGDQLAREPLVVAPAGSAHRAMVAGVVRDPVVAVEVAGWDVMLELARDGLGLAIVNDFCPPPRGMVAVPLAGAARIRYRLLARDGLVHPGAIALRDAITSSCRP